MAWLFEDPKLVLTAGVLVELLLGVALFQTGRGVLGLVMLGVAVLVASLLLVERVVVTDREQVGDSLHRAAAAVEAGDIAAALCLVAPDAPLAVKTEVRRLTERFDVTKVKLNGLRIVVDKRANPPVARATLRVIVSARDRRGHSPYNNFIGTFAVDLRRDNDRWVVFDYERLDQP